MLDNAPKAPVGPDRPGLIHSGGRMIQGEGNSSAGATPVPREFRKEFLRGASLITGGPGSRIVIPEEARSVLAIFDNGITIVNEADNRNPILRKVLQAAHDNGIGVSSRNSFLVPLSVLQQVYAIARSAPDKESPAPSLTSEEGPRSQTSPKQ